MGYRSAEEALNDDVAVLGLGYGTAFHHCCQELWRVSANWDRYEALFGSKERVDILNASSSNFWHVLQGILHEHVLLGICRLTDPSGKGVRQNLSVRRLDEVDPTAEKTELHILVENAVDKAAFARTWRDKRIAHNDLVQATGTANLLAPSTGETISEAIVAIHNVLNWVHRRYFDGDLFLIDIGDSDVNVLMGNLVRAKMWREEETVEIDAKRYERSNQARSNYPSQNYGRESRYSSQSLLPQPKSYRGKLPLET